MSHGKDFNYKERPERTAKQKSEIKSVLCGGTREVEAQDKIINKFIEGGYEFIESISIGGNEIILRFCKIT